MPPAGFEPAHLPEIIDSLMPSRRGEIKLYSSL